MITRSQVQFSSWVRCCVREQGTSSQSFSTGYAQEAVLKLLKIVDWDVKPQTKKQTKFSRISIFRKNMNELCMASLNCGGYVAFVFRLRAGQDAFSGLFLTLHLTF